MSHLSDCASRDAVEGFARVVRLDGEVAWLEPEPGTSCGGCAAAVACGAKGVGTVASRLEARRFVLLQPVSEPRLRLGERVVVGVDQAAFLKGSLAAYALPMLCLLATGLTAQACFGSDGLTLLACLVGLVLGFVLAALLARRLATRGDISPRFLRRADAGLACPSEEFIA